MKTDRPVVLIHSGTPDSDTVLREGLLDAFPNLGLRTASGREELESTLPDAEVLIAWSFPAELLPVASKLRWYQVLGAGVDSLLGAVLPQGLLVTNIRGVFSEQMAEYALTYMFVHAKDVFGLRRLQDERRWRQSAPKLLAGRTVGIAGLGSIGRVIAGRCAALGMDVIGLKRERGVVSGVRRVYVTEEIEELLAQCDYLVLVLPHTPETDRLMTRDRFRLLKPGCFLVSIGRGSVMDENDLAEALRSGRVGGAALDVFAAEPLPASSPLWELENVFVTPHIAGVNRPHELLPALRENLGRYLRGEPLVNRVDLERGY